MEIAINEHVTLLYYSIIAGAVLAMCYDAVRLVRTFFGLGINYHDAPLLSDIELPLIGRRKRHESGKTKLAAQSTAIFVFDLLYMLFAALAVVIFLYRTSNGTPRAFALIGASVGFIVYMKTAARVTAAAASYIFFAVDTVVRYAVWFTVTPIKAIFKFTKSQLSRIYSATIKKAIIRQRYRAAENRQRRYMDKRLSKILADIAEAIDCDIDVRTEKQDV